MSVQKDLKTGKWMVQCRVTDWQGKVTHKKKRGFDTKRDALEWERQTLSKAKADIGMLFGDFIELYFEDMSHRLKATTLDNKHWVVDKKITPVFAKMPLNEITPTDVRKWQNKLTSYRDEKGNPYSQTYLKTVNNQLTAIFNYAVKYYNLSENPCHKAGSMGKKDADEMLFWTREEFELFINSIKDNPRSYIAYMTLYYTGMRIGELSALTPSDIDIEKGIIIINKSYKRLNGEDIVSTPKTPKSNRTVTIPQGLCECLRDYLAKCYELEPNVRLFAFPKHFLRTEMDRGCKISGVKRIRIHDTRHSHASLLIEMGFSPLLIADRLGHEKVQTTMDTYSHLYPTKQIEVANKLDLLMGVNSDYKNVANL